MTRRVVITGIGVVSPLGRDRESSWSALRTGVRAVRRLELGDGSPVLGAPALDLESIKPAVVGATRAARREAGRARRPVNPATDDLSPEAPVGWLGDLGQGADRLNRLAQMAAEEAMTDARLHEYVEMTSDGTGLEPDRRFGCSIGASKGNLDALGAALDQLNVAGIVDPRLWIDCLPGSLSSMLSRRFALGGPGHCAVAACATGLFAVTRAADWILDDRCDLALAGSADASLTPMVLRSYERMGILAPADTEDAQAAVRPFAADRQGFAVGEGAGMFVLEEAEHARARGARVYGRLSGWATGADAAGIANLAPTPDSLVHALRTALAKARLSPQQIGHVNCHGTATATNDPWETEAIKLAFGRHAESLRLTANKSMIGHLLGAAGSVELAMTLLALRDGYVPPTMNLIESDPACDLDYTPNRGVGHAFQAAVKQSIGFGGHVAVAVVERPAPA